MDVAGLVILLSFVFYAVYYRLFLMGNFWAGSEMMPSRLWLAALGSPWTCFE